MAHVTTVLGPVDTATLGRVLMHEHLFGSAAGIADNYPQFYGKDALAVVEKDLNEMRENGILTVVDVTPFDLGRNVRWMRAVSEKTGVNVVASTGFFLEPPPGLGTYSIDDYAQVFIDDITVGMAGTDSKAGMLKTAMDKEGPTKGRELIHRAVARASVATGCPVTLHSYPAAEFGRYQLDWMREEGVPLQRVIIDHCVDTSDLEYLQFLGAQGCWLGVNRLPNILPLPERCSSVKERIRIIKEMIDMGLSDRMLFSHDFQSYATLFRHMPTPEEQAYIDGLNPQRFLFLQKVVFPELEKLGVSAELLEQMFTENPRRFFEEAAAEA